MERTEVRCEACDRITIVEPLELTQWRAGGRLRCPHCGASLGRPLAERTAPAAPERPGESPSESCPRFRLPLERPVRVQLGDRTPVVLSGKTKNLSDSGLLLETPESLRPGTVVALELLCSDREVPLQGRVIWSRPVGTDWAESGIQFIPSPGVGFAVELFSREFLGGEFDPGAIWG